MCLLNCSKLFIFALACLICSSAHAFQCEWNFSPQNQYDTSPDGDLAETTGIDAADFNGDGFLDVAVSNRKTDEVRIFAGDGEGNLSYLSAVTVGTEAIPRYVVSGDFDGDGDIDAATANWGDGAVDGGYNGGSVSILLNDGFGNLTEIDKLFFLRSSCIAVSDIDNDGDPDLIVPHWDDGAGDPGAVDGVATILINNGQAVFSGVDVPIGNKPRGIDVGDLDFDGDLDIAVSNLGDHTVTIIENVGAGNFETVASISVGSQPRYVAIGDLDQDGLGDLAVVNKGDNSLWILKNYGGMVFAEVGIYSTHEYPHSTTIDDINGDCKLDVIVSHVGGAGAEKYVYIYENDGQALMANIFELRSIKAPAHVITADMNVDGRPDILTADTNDGGYTSIHLSEVVQNGCAQCPGDLDRNGSVDVEDLLKVVEFWGKCGPGDLDGNGTVDVSDLLAIVDAWGECEIPVRSIDKPEPTRR
jgi:hypothetical protein